VTPTAKDPEKAVCFSGLALVLLWILITCLSRGISLDWLPASWQSGFAYEVSNDQTPTGSFLVLQSIAWLLLLFAVIQIRSSSRTSGPILIFVVGMALLIRLIAIFGEPIHENDFYRYLWDGEVSLSGVNPFKWAPVDAEKSSVLAELQSRNALFHSRIGHPEVPTIYPPLAQGLFAFSAACFGWSVMAWKGILLCFDMAVVFLLVSCLRRLGKTPMWVILYAWNPLVVKEIANSAHYDAVPIFFCVLALWVALGRLSSMKRAILVALVLAMGTLAKYFAILLLPVLLLFIARGNRRRLAWNFPAMWAGSGIFALTMVLGFLPFLLWDNPGLGRLFSGLGIYLQHWQYSPGLFALVERILALWGWETTLLPAKLLVASLLLLVVARIALSPTRDSPHLAEKCFAVMAALFVLSPTAFPWYFCWVLAFCPVKPRFSWLLLGALLPLNYLDFHSAADIPAAHAHWAGFFLIPSAVWLVFGVAWFSEYRWMKSG